MQQNNKSYWGYGIAAVIILFMIVTLGTVAYTAGLRFDQVTETHYEDAAIYQERIQAIQRTRALPEPVEFELITDTLQFKLFSADNRPIDSLLLDLYRPANKGMDRRMQFQDLKSGSFYKQSITSLSEGTWRIKAEWWSDGKTYFFERKYNLP